LHNTLRINFKPNDIWSSNAALKTLNISDTRLKESVQINQDGGVRTGTDLRNDLRDYLKVRYGRGAIRRTRVEAFANKTSGILIYSRSAWVPLAWFGMDG
jgi:hypothetical protein